MKINIDFSNLSFPNVNKFIKLFMFADFLLLAGWGLINPIFALFVIQDISGATLLTVGILSAIYFIPKSIFQIPISLFLDKTRGEEDDFYSLVIGSMIIAGSVFSFMLATEVWHVYLIQFFKAVGFAFYVPPWNAIFSRHLDKNHTAFDWALHSSVAGFSMGVGGFLGGLVANAAGFDVVFLIVGFMALSTAGVILFAPNIILPRKTTAEGRHVPPIIRYDKHR